LIRLRLYEFSCFAQTHAPWLFDDLSHSFLSSLATLLCVDGVDPSRQRADLVGRNAAECVVMEVNRAALPVSNLILTGGVACAFITRDGYLVDRKSDLVGLRMKLAAVMRGAGFYNVW